MLSPLCTRGAAVREHPLTAPPGARKRSGKNLVFPRGPAAASASDMIVISALCRNNTPPMAQEGPSVTLVRCSDGQNSLKAVWVVSLGAPGVINHHPGGAALQSWQRATDRPDGCNGASQSPQHGHAMLSPLCTRGAAVREHPLTAPPGARKRSGKNLVFPRGPAAALASGMIVISALCRNNTPRVAQEGPSGFRRWEVRCPDSHIFFACVRCFCPGKERNGSSVTLAPVR